MIDLKIKALSNKAILPCYKTDESAGMDIFACLDEPVTIRSLDRVLIPTGIVLEIPKCHVGLVFPRSGLSYNAGVNLINGVGVIDSDYRGQIKIPLINLSKKTYTLLHGDRVSQLIIFSIPKINLIEVENFSKTSRGKKGFGSTGR